MSADQAAGLRQLFGSRRLRMLPLASVLGATEHEALVAHLNCALHEHGCRVHPLDEPSAWFFDRRDDVVLALGDDAQSMTAAYMFIKAAARRHEQRAFRLLFAGTAERFEPRPLVARMARAAKRFLGVDVRLGAVLARTRYADALGEFAAVIPGWRLPEFPAFPLFL